MKRAIWVAILIPLLGGCASHKPVRGVINLPKAGDYFLTDFGFLDQQGDVRYLHDLLGDFTVIAFTRCDQDTHGPVAKLVDDLLRENRGADSVRVVGVDIHWSAEDCKQHKACHLIEDRQDLVSICDATGAIHQPFVHDGGDYLVVVGPGRKIMGAARVDESAPLREALHRNVEQLGSERAWQRSQELGG